MVEMIKIIQAPFGLGAQIEETKFAPPVIEQYLKFEHEAALCESNYQTEPLGKGRLASVSSFSQSLGAHVKDALKEGAFPIVVGGDHSIAIGTWSAVTSYLSAQKDFGLIWIDAHLDSHNFETSPSKAYHGMPLAALLGNGEDVLVNMFTKGAKLSYKHVVLVGARDFEPEEHEFLTSHGVHIFYMSDIRALGLDVVFKKALDIVSQASGGYGISLDMDAFDPKLAPGVGSRAENGIYKDEFMESFDTLLTKQLKCFEIVECNPRRDTEDVTSHLAVDVISRVATWC